MDPNSGFAFVVAGSVSLNTIDNETEAFVQGVQDDLTPSNPDPNAATYALAISATDKSSILTFAGGFSIALGGGNWVPG